MKTKDTQLMRILMQYPRSWVARQAWQERCKHTYYPTFYDSVCTKCGKLKEDKVMKDGSK